MTIFRSVSYMGSPRTVGSEKACVHKKQHIKQGSLSQATRVSLSPEAHLSLGTDATTVVS